MKVFLFAKKKLSKKTTKSPHTHTHTHTHTQKKKTHKPNILINNTKHKTFQLKKNQTTFTAFVFFHHHQQNPSTQTQTPIDST